MKFYKKFSIIALTLAISFSLYFLKKDRSKQNKRFSNKGTIKSTGNKKAKIEDKSPKPKKRNVASVKKVKVSNKQEPWITKYKENFLKLTNSSDINELKIKKQKTVQIKKAGIFKTLEHVIVSYRNNAGIPYSFEALIDPKTGTLVQSFNRTRLEFKKKILFNQEGRTLRE